MIKKFKINAGYSNIKFISFHRNRDYISIFFDSYEYLGYELVLYMEDNLVACLPITRNDFKEELKKFEAKEVENA